MTQSVNCKKLHLWTNSPWEPYVLSNKKNHSLAALYTLSSERPDDRCKLQVIVCITSSGGRRTTIWHYCPSIKLQSILITARHHLCLIRQSLVRGTLTITPTLDYPARRRIWSLLVRSTAQNTQIVSIPITSAWPECKTADDTNTATITVGFCLMDLYRNPDITPS